MGFLHVNHLAVVVSALVSMVIGGLWYSPLLFVKAWLKELGLTEKNMKEMKKKCSPMKSMGWMAVFTLVMGYVIAILLGKLGLIGDVASSAKIGALLWLGLCVPCQISTVLFEGRSLRYFAITAAHTLVVTVVMSSIIGAWA